MKIYLYLFVLAQLANKGNFVNSREERITNSGTVDILFSLSSKLQMLLNISKSKIKAS